MRCATHGDTINCPPFCPNKLAGTQTANEPGASADAARNTSELSSSTTSENRTADDASASRARDLGAAFGDIGTARDALRRMRRELTDLRGAIEYIDGRLADCDELMRKYDDKQTPQQPPQQPNNG